MAVIVLTRFHDGAGPLGLIGAVGELLALQADTDVLRVLLAALADDVGILANTLEVTAIHLYTRLVGEHLHKDTSLGTVK